MKAQDRWTLFLSRGSIGLDDQYVVAQIERFFLESNFATDKKSSQVNMLKTRGKRVTIEDAGGAKLIDLIVGGYDEAGGGYFVREADSNEVFTAKLNLDISTKFIDWVKPNLLQISNDDVRAIVVHDYSVDENRQAIVTRSETRLSREKADGEWSSAQVPAEQRVAKAQVDVSRGNVAQSKAALHQAEPDQSVQIRGHPIG